MPPRSTPTAEGEEGKFYVWTRDEIAGGARRGGRRAIFAEVYDVTGDGNFEGHNILNRLHWLALRPADEEQRLAGLRAKLLAERDKRVRPGWDDKVLADWNGLMIAALARAAVVFERPEWLQLAKRAFDFVATRMSANGRLLHAYRDGRAKAPATASDYANMIWAALRLHEATNERRYFEQARRLGRTCSTSTTGWRAAAAMQLPPTIRATSSCGCGRAPTMRRPTPTASCWPTWWRWRR